MEWPAALGIYGAIAATLTAGWNIYSGVRDRGRLELQMRMRRFVQNEYGEEIEEPVDQLKGTQLHLARVNTGRRRITVTAWRGIPSHSGANDDVTPLHEVTCLKLLNETDQEFMVSRDFLGAFATDLRRLYVTDSSGRHWYIPQRQLRAVRRQIETLRSSAGSTGEATP